MIDGGPIYHHPCVGHVAIVTVRHQLDTERVELTHDINRLAEGARATRQATARVPSQVTVLVAVAGLDGQSICGSFASLRPAPAGLGNKTQEVLERTGPARF